MSPEIAAGEITAAAANGANETAISAHDCDASPQRIAMQLRIKGTHRQPVSRARRIVAIEMRRAIGIAHEHVDIAIVVDIADRQAARDLNRIAKR